MIYSHKPQRSGRSITTNTNNPPQDPPPPPDKTISLDDIPKVLHVSEIPDIPINDTTPPVPEICVEAKPVIVIPEKKISKPKEIPKQTLKPKIPIKEKTQKEIPKISLFRRILAKLKSFFGRK